MLSPSVPPPFTPAHTPSYPLPSPPSPNSLPPRLDDGSYDIDGLAELEAVTKVLDLSLGEDTLSEFATLSGFLCHQASAER
jgi:hypothetical protein